MSRRPLSWHRAARAWLCAATLATGCAAHATDLQVQTLTHPGNGATQRFPFVVAADAALAQRINQRLFIESFERMAPAQAGAGLRELDAQVWQSTPSLGFRVLRNDARILSLQIQGESCGAYCENYTASHAFDAGTGRHLESEDLLTPQGRDALARRMQQNDLRAMRRQVAALKKSQRHAPKARRNAEDDMDARIALLEGCMAERGDGGWLRLQGVGTLAVEARALAFTQPRCSNHAMRALDDIGEFVNRWPLEQVRGWLTPYGATLLLGEGRVPAPDAPFGQVLRGTLGERQAVTVWVQPRRDDGSVSGVYFYDRFRRPILLFGQARDGALELDESESGGRWRLQREGPSLRGTWTGGTKQLPVVLAP